MDISSEDVEDELSSMSSDEELVTDETDINDPDIQQIMREVFGNFIGASVSEPLFSDLNVNFICLSVSLSVMDCQSTVNRFRILFCTFCIIH